jgi:hypothetical protein
VALGVLGRQGDGKGVKWESKEVLEHAMALYIEGWWHLVNIVGLEHVGHGEALWLGRKGGGEGERGPVRMLGRAGTEG